METTAERIAKLPKEEQLKRCLDIAIGVERNGNVRVFRFIDKSTFTITL